MRRTEKYPETRTFHLYNANPKNRVTGDCTFRAIATALEKPWTEVVMEMAELSCRTGYAINDKKGIERYLAEQGWTKHRQPRKWDNTKYTGQEFCKVQQKYLHDKNVHGAEWDDGIIIDPKIVASIGGNHITAIIDGKVNDTWDCTNGCIGNYWTK